MALLNGYASHCNDAEALGLNGGDIFRYMGTPSVTHDMVAMLDGLQPPRREQFELRKRSHDDDVDDVPRMQYIGFSYGTILGNYFAALHPERVGRLVLDGVCDTNDYANGPVSTHHLKPTYTD